MKLCQKVFAVIFITALLGFAIFNIINKFYDIKHDVVAINTPENILDGEEYVAKLDTALQSNVMYDRTWNEAYSMVYNALNKNEENGFKYVRDKDGILYPGNFWNTPTTPASEYTKRINVLRKKVEDKGTEVVVLLYPCKYNEAWSNGYNGIPYADYNNMIDELTAYFRYYSINYIDYRDYFLNNGWKATDIFYKTDKNWNTQASFAGYQEMVRYLNKELGAGLNTYYTDESKYEMVTYKNYFIGAQGRDAGVGFVGLDDYTLMVPKFKTDYTYTYITGNTEYTYSGKIDKTLINYQYFGEEDYYDRDMYSTYMGGIHVKDKVINNKNPHGPKVLFIRDSYASTLGTFFSSHCSEMDFLWSAHLKDEEIESIVENGSYDYIFIGLTVDSFINGGFEIYEDEVLTNE